MSKVTTTKQTMAPVRSRTPKPRSRQPKVAAERQTQSLSPFKNKDKRKTLPELPKYAKNEVLYVYINAIKSQPQLVETIGDFLDRDDAKATLYPNQASKERLGRLPNDWNRSKTKERISPSEEEAPIAAAYVEELKVKYWSTHRGHRMSDSDSEQDIETPPSSPKLEPATKTRTPKPRAKSVKPFQPEPPTFEHPKFNMTDPPTDTTFPHGFDSSELVDYDTIRRCNNIVAIDPRDPSTFPDGIIAWEDKDIKVQVQGTELLKDRVAVLVHVPSPEAAELVTTVKLEKKGNGLKINMCAQDPHFVENLGDIMEEVAEKAGTTLNDEKGIRFAAGVRKKMWLWFAIG